MASATGQMIRAGGVSGNPQLYIEVDRIGQDASQNISIFRIIVEYRGNGNQGWSIRGNSWSASAGPYGWRGVWSIPNGTGGGTTRLLDTTFSIKHDAGGALGPVPFRADASSTNRAYIGYGSAAGTEEAPPRLSRKPSKPGNPTFTNVLPTIVTVSWDASGDNGGSAIDGYLLRYWPNEEGSGPYTDHSQTNNRSRTVTNLKPGLKYRFVVYAHNGSSENNGYSEPTDASVVRMFAGFRIRIGGHWKRAIVWIKKDGKWKQTIPFFKKAGKWKITS